MTDKVCSHCLNAWPPTEEFFPYNPNPNDRLSSWCRACMNELAAARYLRKKAERTAATS